MSQMDVFEGESDVTSRAGSLYDDAGSINSESSMIFERNVEDPYQQSYGNPRLASLSRTGSNANIFAGDGEDIQGGQSATSLPALQRKQSLVSGHVPHRHLENLVAPVLDEGVTIINDDSADLENVEMVYSRRPSTIGLDMALGRSRTNSSSDAATLNAPQISKLMRTNSASQGSGVEGRPRVLRFYSYADMLSDETAKGRRPSISQSLSSSLLRQQGENQKNNGGSQSAQVSPHFSNPFLSNHPADADRKNSFTSIPPLSIATRHYSSNMLSRSPNQGTANIPAGQRLSCSPLMAQQNLNGSILRRGNFQIDSSGSECSDEEEHENNETYREQRSAGASGTSPGNAMGSRLSRTSTQGSNFNKKLSPPLHKARTYSNASGISPYANNFSRGSFSSANTQNMDDLLFDEQLQTSTVSEVLKKKLTNEI